MLGPVHTATVPAHVGKPQTPEQKKLMGACKDFESVMLGMVFKQLDASTGKDDPLAKGSVAESPTPDTLSSYPAAVRPQLESLPVNGTTAPTQLMTRQGPAYVIFRLVQKIPAQKADLVAMRSDVELDYKLAQLAMKTVKLNPKNPPFDETLTRTAAFLEQQRGREATLRDTLDYINQGEVGQLVSELSAAASVQMH